jgi:hypothetical protein
MNTQTVLLNALQIKVNEVPHTAPITMLEEIGTLIALDQRRVVDVSRILLLNESEVVTVNSETFTIQPNVFTSVPYPVKKAIEEKYNAAGRILELIAYDETLLHDFDISEDDSECVEVLRGIDEDPFVQGEALTPAIETPNADAALNLKITYYDKDVFSKIKATLMTCTTIDGTYAAVAECVMDTAEDEVSDADNKKYFEYYDVLNGATYPIKKYIKIKFENFSDDTDALIDYAVAIAEAE